MADQPTTPEPSDRDRRNAAIRQIIAERQNAEYAEVLKLALGALGPGWTPWMKLTLVESDHRQTGNVEPVATAYKVYRGEQRLTENAVFLRRLPDGQVLKADNYEELFGELLTENHPSRVLDFKGRQAPYPRWTLCWSALERYTPRSADALAALRISRQQGREVREHGKFAEENPLFAQAGIKRPDVER